MIYVTVWLNKPVPMPERYGRDEEDRKTGFKYTFKGGVDDDEGGNECLVIETYTQEAFDMLAADIKDLYAGPPEESDEYLLWD